MKNYELILFIGVQLAIVLSFVILANPFKKVSQTKLLATALVTRAIQLHDAVLLLFLCVTILKTNTVHPWHWVGLILTALGVIMIVFARLALTKDNYAPVGLFRENCKLTTCGIYSIIRHPLYSGVFLFISGSYLVTLGVWEWFWYMLVLAACISVVSLVYQVSLLEDKALLALFGENFEQYRKRTPAFFPKWRVKL